MLQQKLAKQVLLAIPTARWHRSQTNIRWRVCISDLAWPGVGVETAELPQIDEKPEVW